MAPKQIWALPYQSEGVSMAQFDLYIQPEKGAGAFPVSLWAARGSGVRQRLYTAPPACWLEYSRRLEQARLMGARDLGRADACIFRGEPIVQSILCSPHDLAEVGFGETQVRLPRHLRLSSLLDCLDQNPTSKSLVEQALDSKPPSSVDEESFVVPESPEFGPDPVPGFECSSNGTKAILDLALSTGNPLKDQPSSSAIVAKAATKMMRSFRHRIALLGVGIDNLSMDEVVEVIDHLIDKGGCHQVATANVDFLSKAFDDRELLDILHCCELVVPDGMPLVWAARMLGIPLKERVTGADLVPRLLELSALKKRRIFLLGATEENSCAAVERISKEYPDAIICGRHSPPFTSGGWIEDESILQLVREAKPDLLLVAFGNPKQEKWIAKHRDRLGVPVCIGVGASIDFLSGRHSRAPLWMQNYGLEWMHRLINEPRRLALRYLNNALFLLRYLSVQLVTTALQSRASKEQKIELVQHGAILTVGIVGGFCGSTAKELFERIEECNYDGSFILDLTYTEFIAPDATGMLICLAQRCARTGNELWIAGGTSTVRSLLRATFPAGEPFRIAENMKDALRFARSPSLSETGFDNLGSEAV